MTFEHRVICGLEEIKAIVFECKECKARVSLDARETKKPPATCPNGHHWDWNVYLGYGSTESPYVALLSALTKLTEPGLKDVGFKVFLEFEEPKHEK
jgi:hypothetical protein